MQLIVVMGDNIPQSSNVTAAIDETMLREQGRLCRTKGERMRKRCMGMYFDVVRIDWPGSTMYQNMMTSESSWRKY